MSETLEEVKQELHTNNKTLKLFRAERNHIRERMRVLLVRNYELKQQKKLLERRKE